MHLEVEFKEAERGDTDILYVLGEAILAREKGHRLFREQENRVVKAGGDGGVLKVTG